MKNILSFVLFAFCLLANISFAEDFILKPDKQIGRNVPVVENKAVIRFKSGTDISSAFKILNKSGIIVDLPILEKTQSITFNRSKSKISGLSVNKINNIIVAEEPLLRTFVISYQKDIIPEFYCRMLLKEYKFIEIAEPQCVDDILVSFPNDPKVSQQTLLATCKILDAWDVWRGDTNLIIGISDGGIFQAHEDLINNIAPNWGEIPNDGIDNDNNGYIDDFLGYNFAYKTEGTLPDNTYHSSDHGTAVASIAAATTNNGIGLAGVGYKCRFFPMKTAKLSSNSISFGYQSIVYAAVRGFKVLNCSWGSPKQFSQIDQSIIDYAISRDVAIVAAAGNENGSIVPVYPASYNGVLSVGNVDINDEVAGSSSLGANLDIMAPGQSSFVATNTQSGYMIEPQGGTSFSSPVVAGVLGLVRSKYPNLSALESIAFIRLAVDDIRDKNPSNAGILPGRINALKAVTTDPMSVPGIVNLSHKFYINGEETERVYNGQRADLKINCRNILGIGKNLRFVLSAGYDFQKTINVIDSVVNISDIPRNSDFTLDKFSFSCNNDYNGTVILRIDIYGDNNYHDFFMIPFIPASEVTTLGNNIMQFSVGDRGQIGFAGSQYDIQGIGVKYKNLGNMVYNAGLMLTAENAGSKYISSALFGAYPNYNDFISVKSFTPPNIFKGVLNDDGNFVNKLNAEVEQIFNVPSNNINIMAVDVTITNKSNLTYDNLASGYFFDWDIPPVSDSNIVAIFPEAIPETFKAIAASAEYASFYQQNKSIFCGCASFSNNEKYFAQVAGMDYSTIQNFSLDEQFAALNSDTNIQFKGINDINMVVGMRFPGPIPPNDSRTFKFFFGCAGTKSDLAESLKKSMLGMGAEIPVESDSYILDIYPLPAENNLNVVLKNISGFSTIEFYNVLGNSVLDKNFIQFSTTEYAVTKDISSLSNGLYFVKINSNGVIKIKAFIKNKNN